MRQIKLKQPTLKKMGGKIGSVKINAQLKSEYVETVNKARASIRRVLKEFPESEYHQSLYKMFPSYTEYRRNTIFKTDKGAQENDLQIILNKATQYVENPAISTIRGIRNTQKELQKEYELTYGSLTDKEKQWGDTVAKNWIYTTDYSIAQGDAKKYAVINKYVSELGLWDEIDSPTVQKMIQALYANDITDQATVQAVINDKTLQNAFTHRHSHFAGAFKQAANILKPYKN